MTRRSWIFRARAFAKDASVKRKMFGRVYVDLKEYEAVFLSLPQVRDDLS